MANESGWKPRVVYAWWPVWVLTGSPANVQVLVPEEPTLEELRTVAQVGMGFLLVELVAAIFVITIVLRISAWQSEPRVSAWHTVSSGT